MAMDDGSFGGRTWLKMFGILLAIGIAVILVFVFISNSIAKWGFLGGFIVIGIVLLVPRVGVRQARGEEERRVGPARVGLGRGGLGGHRRRRGQRAGEALDQLQDVGMLLRLPPGEQRLDAVAAGLDDPRAASSPAAVSAGRSGSARPARRSASSSGASSSGSSSSAPARSSSSSQPQQEPGRARLELDAGLGREVLVDQVAVLLARERAEARLELLERRRRRAARRSCRRCPGRRTVSRSGVSCSNQVQANAGDRDAPPRSGTPDAARA